MNYLVDANVLSEATKPEPDSRVVAWLRKHELQLFIDPIIAGEVLRGILMLPGGRKRRLLDLWFTSFVENIECLPWDRDTGKRWAQLVFDLKLRGQLPSIVDTMIAATALTHNLTVATRNVDDFRASGVRIVNPFH